MGVLGGKFCLPGSVDLPEQEGGERSLCTGLIVVDTRAELAKLVLQTPCVTPAGSEFSIIFLSVNKFHI